MKRAPTLRWIVAAVLVAGFFATSVLAASPSAVVVYGGKLDHPILLRPTSNEEADSFRLLWWQAGPYSRPTRTVHGDPELISGLRNRPYVNMAIFWGQYPPDQLEPENASQHGRFYPPTTSEPAIVVVTIPDMQKKSNPIPKDLAGFVAVWTLSPQELGTLKELGFPGL